MFHMVPSDIQVTRGYNSYSYQVVLVHSLFSSRIGIWGVLVLGVLRCMGECGDGLMSVLVGAY